MLFFPFFFFFFFVGEHYQCSKPSLPTLRSRSEGKMSVFSSRAAAVPAAASPPRSLLRHEARCVRVSVRIEFLRSCRRPQQHRRREPLVVASSAINNNDDARPPPSSSPSRSSPPLPGSAPLGFSAPDASRFRLAVLGDLHYDPRDEEAFSRAQEQLARALKDKAAADEGEAAEEGKGGKGGRKRTVSRLVQLGDLGASSFAPGTPSCFEHAREFLGSAAVEGESFGAPPALVAGNHGKFLSSSHYFLFFFASSASFSLSFILAQLFFLRKFQTKNRPRRNHL